MGSRVSTLALRPRQATLHFPTPFSNNASRFDVLVYVLEGKAKNRPKWVGNGAFRSLEMALFALSRIFSGAGAKPGPGLGVFTTFWKSPDFPDSGICRIWSADRKSQIFDIFRTFPGPWPKPRKVANPDFSYLPWWKLRLREISGFWAFPTTFSPFSQTSLATLRSFRYLNYRFSSVLPVIVWT